MTGRTKASASLLTIALLAAAQPAVAAEVIFSSAPIDPTKPPATTTTFKAGDRIYSLLQADKSWRDSLGERTSEMIVYFSIDDQRPTYKLVGVKKPDVLAGRTFVLDIAPDPAKMTNYRDPDIIFPSKDGLRFGPELFTKYLSELTPGKHTIKVEVASFGKVHSTGQFEIEGTEFAAYAKVHAEIKGAASGMVTMPKAGMTNPGLEKEMRTLLGKAGWKNILRLVIVDKDWWMERVSGGDSPIKSRYVVAAVAAKASDGSCFYSNVTFTQPKTITGAWGSLEITNTGQKNPIPEKNVKK